MRSVLGGVEAERKGQYGAISPEWTVHNPVLYRAAFVRYMHALVLCLDASHHNICTSLRIDDTHVALGLLC